MLSDLVGAATLCAPDTRGAGSCSPENPYLCTAGPSHLGCASSPWAVGAGAPCESQCMHPGFVYAANQTGYSLDSGQEQVLRYIVAASGILSLLGSAVIMWSALRFTELTKRFFAIRLISFLALTDACASVFNIMGGFVDVSSLRSARPPLLCQVQAAGLLYFNLSSIMWTSCFAFTLYRDVAPRRSGAGRRDLRKYEGYFHLLCWPVPAALAAASLGLGFAGDSGGWCAARRARPPPTSRALPPPTLHRLIAWPPAAQVRLRPGVHARVPALLLRAAARRLRLQRRDVCARAMLVAGPRNYSAAQLFLRAILRRNSLTRPPVPCCAGSEGVAQRLLLPPSVRHRLAALTRHAAPGLRVRQTEGADVCARCARGGVHAAAGTRAQTPSRRAARLRAD